VGNFLNWIVNVLRAAPVLLPPLRPPSSGIKIYSCLIALSNDSRNALIEASNCSVKLGPIESGSVRTCGAGAGGGHVTGTGTGVAQLQITGSQITTQTAVFGIDSLLGFQIASDGFFIPALLFLSLSLYGSHETGIFPLYSL
jgi:hypothetical protein